MLLSVADNVQQPVDNETAKNAIQLSRPRRIPLLAILSENFELLFLTDVEDGAVVRMPKAYPVCDPGYADALKTVREFMDGLSNLQLVGRNGMHKYNNQDHSMLTAMLAVKNILG